jgi:hypothetical protein
MMIKGFKQAFEEWWYYYLIKELHQLTPEEMKQYSKYVEGPPFVEAAKRRMYRNIPFKPENDETNHTPIERGEEDGA